jgi:hypothetical protein
MVGTLPSDQKRSEKTKKKLRSKKNRKHRSEKNIYIYE